MRVEPFIKDFPPEHHQAGKDNNFFPTCLTCPSDKTACPGFAMSEESSNISSTLLWVLASDQPNCFDEPITCCDSYISQFDDGKETDVAIVELQNENCHGGSTSIA